MNMMTGDSGGSLQQPQNALITQSFGNEKEYRRAIMMIWSFWARCTEFSDVILYTDNPEYFKPYFKEQPIQYVLLTPEKIRVMRGDIDFLHRMKIVLIDEAFNMITGSLLYADSDTFFLKDPSKEVNSVNDMISYMHLREYRFDSLYAIPEPAGTIFHKFVNHITDQTFVGHDGITIPATATHYSWNAGVMVFHHSQKRFLTDVYMLAENFYAATLNHACEQYAFSIVLSNNTELRGCEDTAYHYWYREKKKVVDLFLLHKITKEWARLPKTKKIDDIITWSNRLPSIVRKSPIVLADQAIQAFHANNFSQGYRNAALTLIKKPFDYLFAKEVLYHTKRFLTGLLHGKTN